MTDDCVFCEGRRANENGEPLAANPYPQPPAELRGTDSYHEDPWVLWHYGWKSNNVP